jgi:hypothetical protein
LERNRQSRIHCVFPLVKYDLAGRSVPLFQIAFQVTGSRSQPAAAPGAFGGPPITALAVAEMPLLAHSAPQRDELTLSRRALQRGAFAKHHRSAIVSDIDRWFYRD